jgi:hypothetical protein
MSKAAIKSPTKKKPNQRFFTCMMRAYKHVLTYESGIEMAVFYDTVEEDLTSSHDGGMGTRTMRTAGVRSC